MLTWGITKQIHSYIKCSVGCRQSPFENIRIACARIASRMYLTAASHANQREPYTLTIQHVNGLPRTFILESDSKDRLLVNPGRKLLGLPRMQTAYEATTTWCHALYEQEFLPRDPQQICSMTVLAEGVGHNLPGALASVLPAPQRG